MTEETLQPEGDTLSETELAYFNSGGEAEIAADPPEQAAEQAAKPAPEPEEGQAQQERDEKGRFVPHGALHAEREEHKKTKAQLEEIARKTAILEDRWNTLLAASQQQPQAQVEDDPAPDPNVDIFAYVEWQGRQMQKLQQKITAEEQQKQQTVQQMQEEREILGIWQNEVQRFTQQQKDFPDAAQYLANLRSQQLSALGLDPATVNATIDAELKGVIKHAKTQGLSPAQVIYEYAKVSGYQPAQQQQAAPDKLQLPENLAKVAQAQEASKTIASGSGKAGADPLTPESIAAMSDKEFEVWLKDPENARRFERMMGG